MKELLVEKSKIKNNLKIINNIINKNGKYDNGEKVKLIAVVKGNGYGLDLVQYSKFLADNGVKMFAVATVEEALELRRGGIKEDILMMLKLKYNRIKKTNQTAQTLSITKSDKTLYEIT